MSQPLSDEQEDIRRRLLSSLPPGKQPFDLRALNTALMARADADTQNGIYEEYCFRAGLTGMVRAVCLKHTHTRICTDCIKGVPLKVPGQPENPLRDGKKCKVCGGSGWLRQQPLVVFICKHVLEHDADSKPSKITRTRRGFFVCSICAGLWARKKFDYMHEITTACRSCVTVELFRLRGIDPALVVDNAGEDFKPLAEWSLLDLGDDP